VKKKGKERGGKKSGICGAKREEAVAAITFPIRRGGEIGEETGGGEGTISPSSLI